MRQPRITLPSLAPLLLAFCLFPLPAQSPESGYVLGVKLLKHQPEPIIKRVILPGDCVGCLVLEGPEHAGSNAREDYFHLWIPKEITHLNSLRIASASTASVKAVIVQKDRIPWLAHDGEIEVSFQVPTTPPVTTELHTHLREGIIDLRVEHAFPSRRAGKYASGRWPAIEVAAALNLEFAMRDAAKLLGLDQDIEENALGALLIMGFDTNYPTLGKGRAHEDWPPHCHMHLMWPHRAGTQIGHLYLDQEGLLTHNSVTLIPLWDWPARTYGRGQRHTTVDYYGHPVYSLTITETGWLRLERSRGGACLLRPVAKGFHTGVVVDCAALGTRSISASDNVESGLLEVTIDGKKCESYVYDPDTAELLGFKRPEATP